MPTYESDTIKLDMVDRSLQERDIILSQLKTNLADAQVRMKQQADKHWSQRSFDVRDMVFLRLVPYQHQSLPKHYFHKLQPKFYGPFKVLAKVGSVAYKIDVRSTSKLHPVFHHLLLDETIEFWNCSCSTIARGNRGGYFGRLSHCHFATE